MGQTGPHRDARACRLWGTFCFGKTHLASWPEAAVGSFLLCASFPSAPEEAVFDIDETVDEVRGLAGPTPPSR
ncbi:MAG: hypothetical protein WBX25_06715 [Rhodomicrobium sp.]